MSRISLMLLQVMFIYAGWAYGDFYPVQPITFSGPITAPRTEWEKNIGQPGKPHFAPMHVENVAVKSQNLRITFRDPDAVEVESGYILNVYENDVYVEVQYIFGSYDYFLEGEGHYVSGIEDFAVELSGRPVDPGEISYFVIEPEPGNPGHYTAVFPFDFLKAGDYKVRLSYSYKVPGGFSVVKDNAYEGGRRYGFTYDIGALQYWAGDVDEINIDVVLEGRSITDFGSIYPSDFFFTPKGCKWGWRCVTDGELSEHGSLGLFFGKAGSLYGDFTDVLREEGLDVYDYPDPESQVLRVLKKGERVYLYRDPDDTKLNDAMYERGWRKCRLIDNSEGYVITWLPEYFVESFERRKMIGDFPLIYGGEKP